MDAPVDENAAAVKLGVVAPLHRIERELLLNLDQPYVSKAAAVDDFLGSFHRGHEPVVLRHHQGDPGGGSRSYYGRPFSHGASDGFFEKDVLAAGGGQPGVLEMQVMGSANVKGLNPRVVRRFGVGAEKTGASELSSVHPGAIDLPAGEIQVDFAG